MPTLSGSALAALLAAAAAAAGPEALRLNQIQVIGTHNSYHAGLGAGVRAVIARRDPAAAEALDYAHAPLARQLDAGVRQVELDVFADAAGGRFARPFGAALEPGGLAAFDPEGVFRRPGFKVMHVQDLDYRSTCQPLRACLAEIRDWSRAHPRHVPLFVLVETKTQPPLPGLPMAQPEPFTAPALAALDAEVRQVFDRSEILTPDDVRGTAPTLEAAVTGRGWPPLAAVRGRVVFLLDQTNVSDTYRAGRPSLEGRVFFTNAEPGRPDAAFVERNDGPPEAIAELVRRGYLVRTRSDADTREGRSGSTARRDAALASGAQIVSTDYPASEPARWTGYAVALPGGVAARCDPVSAPACTEPVPAP